MPQFELEDVGPERVTGLHRGRSAEEAILRALDRQPGTPLAVADEEDLHGWREVTIDGAPAGRVRTHQRMRFRRD
jgi:hypothetical protein